MGKIYLVGFGPGAENQMTERAKEAISEATTVIGYSTYIKLVDDLLGGKEVIKKGMTEELDRCVLAYEKAQAGAVVALISSGDIGVYGMAGPMYEYLFDMGWRPGGPIEVEVVPGVTALSAAASLVGAPLTHDFCSISLSDLLTPWATIAARLEAAAKADFVVALYNPKSGRRTGQILEAMRIFLKHKNPQTPVAVVKSAYRPKQKIELCTLEELADQEIGMLTTVLIGNSASFVDQGLLVTPRGYANKYLAAGEVKEGEQAGKSLTLGLDNWPTSLKGKKRSPIELAQFYKLPLGEIFYALSQGENPTAQAIAKPVMTLKGMLAKGGAVIASGNMDCHLPFEAQELFQADLRLATGRLTLPLTDLAQAYVHQEVFYGLDSPGNLLFALY